MRGSIGLGLAAALIAGAASAQEAADGNLTLLCQGVETIVMPTTSYDRLYGGVTTREGRQPAQLVVVLEGGQVRVRPPELSVPVYAKRSADGWYVLTDTVVDKFTIRGRAKFSRIDRDKLNVDRRTGAATFGAFSGICNRVADTPSATRF